MLDVSQSGPFTMEVWTHTPQNKHGAKLRVVKNNLQRKNWKSNLSGRWDLFKKTLLTFSLRSNSSGHGRWDRLCNKPLEHRKLRQWNSSLAWSLSHLLWIPGGIVSNMGGLRVICRSRNGGKSYRVTNIKTWANGWTLLKDMGKHGKH